MYVVVFGLSMARWKGNQDGPCLEGHLCHQPAHTHRVTDGIWEILLCRQLCNYACVPLFQCDTSAHLCRCLHCMCFLDCIVKVASLCYGWIIHSETVKVTILLLKPFCRILVPKLFHKNNYFPVKLPGSCTVHIAHTCICGRQALQSLLKDSSTSRSSLLSWKSNTCTGKGNTMEPLNYGHSEWRTPLYWGHYLQFYLWKRDTSLYRTVAGVVPFIERFHNVMHTHMQ